MNKPTDSVRLALFDADDPTHILVLAEKDDPTNWKLTGGKFDSVDETPDDAAARELNEELGIDGKAVGLRKSGELVNNDGVSARYIYSAFIRRNEVRPSDEIEGVRWVTEDTIPDSPNREHMLSAIRLARTTPQE